MTYRLKKKYFAAATFEGLWVLSQKNIHLG